LPLREQALQRWQDGHPCWDAGWELGGQCPLGQEYREYVWERVRIEEIGYCGLTGQARGGAWASYQTDQ
jgi:hypothetical protein